MNVTDYTTKSLDHLGLVSVLCKELGVANFIDERIPKQTTQSHITHGELLVAMILNGLGFVSRTLHMVPDYFAEKPVERLIGSGIKAEHINDDAIGRCLDKLYEHDVSSLYQDLAERVVKYLGLPCNLVHLDCIPPRAMIQRLSGINSVRLLRAARHARNDASVDSKVMLLIK